jgi:hypothetical protein
VSEKTSESLKIHVIWDALARTGPQAPPTVVRDWLHRAAPSSVIGWSGVCAGAPVPAQAGCTVGSEQSLARRLDRVVVPSCAGVVRHLPTDLVARLPRQFSFSVLSSANQLRASNNYDVFWCSDKKKYVMFLMCKQS